MQDLSEPCVVSGWTHSAFSRFGFDAFPLANPLAEAAAIVLLVPVLLQAALWNGFPLLFFDTGAYMLEGFGHLFVPERAPVYAFFLRYGGGQANLWLIACLQCLMVSFLMVQTMRALRPRTGLLVMLLSGFVLCLVSGVSWISGQIEPDGFTAPVVLSLYLLGFHGRSLGWVRGLVAVFIGALAIAAHPSHIGLAAGLVICTAAYRVLCWYLGRSETAPALPRARCLPPLVALFLSFVMIFAANYSLTHKVFFNRSGNIFLAARLIGSGVAGKTLDAACPTHPMPICRYRDHLPKSADAYLWGPHTPFNKIGRFYGDRAQYDFIVRESLKRYPFEILGNGLWSAFRQFFMIRTGDGITYANWVLNPGFAHFMPSQSPAYLSARQQEGETGFKLINIFQVPLLFASLIGMIAVLVQAVRRRDANRAVLPAFILLALIGNALICGMCSGPHDRYQSRIIWIVPFALLITERTRVWRFTADKLRFRQPKR